MDTERVLIASADSRTNQVLVYKLTNAGYRVHTAASGKKLWRKPCPYSRILSCCPLPFRIRMDLRFVPNCGKIL